MADFGDHRRIGHCHLADHGTATINMNNHKLVKNWHRKILDESENRIGRPLTAEEALFITSRGGFIALEVINDTVMSLRGKELEDYLNSENR